MGAFFVSLLGFVVLAAAFEKAQEIAERADARRRAEESWRRATRPRQASPASGPARPRVAVTRVASATVPASNPRLAARQRQHDADCLAKVRRAEGRGNPRQYYVYEHVDSSGRVRYVGHGTKGRAWSRVRADDTHRAMLEAGRLTIRVVDRGLTAREAVAREADRIDRRSREGAALFNKLRGTRL